VRRLNSEVLPLLGSPTSPIFMRTPMLPLQGIPTSSLRESLVEPKVSPDFPPTGETAMLVHHDAGKSPWWQR
jgi:hypothetical protein